MGVFKEAYDLVRKNEGGYSNNPNDRGGETYKGIARKMFPSWSGWIYIDALKANNSPSFKQDFEKHSSLQDAVQTFYKNEFWDKLSLDDVSSQVLCNELFDTAVNMGIGISGMFIQRVLNVANKQATLYPDVKVDGNVGPNTVKMINSHPNWKVLYKGFNSLQGAKYIEICEHNLSLIHI